MHDCGDGGTLVAGDGYIPDDPAEGWAPGCPEPAGCTALVCERCRAHVRHGPGRLGVTPTEAAYEAADPFVAASPLRTWLCRCTAMSVGAARTVMAPTEEGFRPPWRCSGHPEPALPWTGHGITFEPGFVALDIVRHAFLHGAPASARPRDRQFPDGWIARIARIFGESTVADDIQEAAAALLTDPEPMVRGRAARFAHRIPTGAAAGRIRTVLAENVDLYRGVRDPSGDTTLEDTLAMALAFRAEIRKKTGSAFDPAARKYLFAKVALGPAAVATLPAVARIDSGWLAKNAAWVAATSTGAPRAIVEALVYNKTREAIAGSRALVKSGDLEKAVVKEIFEYSSHPDRLAALTEFA